MTLGNFISREELDKAYEDVISIKESFITNVNKVSVEIIDDNGDSIIELEMDF